MNYQEFQTNQLLDKISDYAEDWEGCLNMVAQAQLDGDKSMFFQYLEILEQRLKNMRREFNIVSYNPKTECYAIQNYDFNTYDWFFKNEFQRSTITPLNLYIHKDDLSPKQRETLQAKIQ